MSDYNTYVFKFNDKLSKGLDFVEDANHPLVVKIAYTAEEGGAQVTNYHTLTRTSTAPGDYSLTVTPVYEDGSNEVKDHTDLLITITNLKSLIENDDNTTDVLKPGQNMIVTYYAKINDKAVINGTGNPNEAKVEYSNNHGTNETGESEPDVSKVYVYSIDIFKFTSDNNNKVPLSGAKFKIKKTANDNDYISLIRVGNTGSVYRVATAEEVAAFNAATDQNPVNYTIVQEVTSPADGHIYIQGLNLDTNYYLEETEPPTGFNPITGVITVSLSADNSSTDDVTENNPETIYCTINGTQKSASNDYKVEVENRQGSVLPTTGGIGTIILTVIGAGIVIIGIVLPLSKKKKDSKSR